MKENIREDLERKELSAEKLEQITGGNGFPGGCPDFHRKGLPVSGDGSCPHSDKYGKEVECYYCDRKEPVGK